MPPKTITTLAHRLVDYAGLFPPAGLDMAAAVAEYARERESPDAWMLARFVVPVGRLGQFSEAAHDLLGAGGGPWPLSALAGGDPAADRAAIDAFNRAHAGRAAVESVEVRAAAPEEVAAVVPAFAGLETYVEIPHADDPAASMEAVARHGARAKIRTGGVVAEAIPAAAEVARFVCAAAAAGVAFKATAGLHHPLRGEYRLTYEPGSGTATMHGYLNVFVAAALAKGGLGEDEIVELLEEREASAFEVDGERLRWRGHEVSRSELAAVREGFATSYGSCSFREPVDELRALRLL